MLKNAVHTALLVLLLAGCTTTSSQYVKEGQQYGVTKGTFHGRWWNYYERGTSYLSGGFYDEARADFAKALEGRSRDTWSARTYGMHFVEYFPNRELGVAAYHLGDLETAEKYLESSLAQIDTARGHDYLDLVKKARIARGELRDTDAPTVAASLEDGTLVASRTIPVRVEARDDLAVAHVLLNGRQLHQRGSAREVSFEDEVLLDEGEHTISLVAGDLAEKHSAQDVNVTVDLTGPSLGIFEPPLRLVTDHDTVRLRGAAVDANGVSSVRVGDRELAGSPGEGGEQVFEADLPLVDGENTFVVVAKDNAGNETFATVSVMKAQQARLVSFLAAVPERLLRPLQVMQVKFAEPARFFPELAKVRFAADTAEAVEPLSVHLEFPKENGEYRKNEIKVTGRVAATTRVESLRINEAEFPMVSAPVVNFTKRIPLERGPNVIQVVAEDDQGRQAQKELEVIGRQLELDSPESKMSLAVMGFGGTDAELCSNLRVGTENQLVRRQRFALVERQRLAEVLQEQQLSEALGDPDKALRLGNVVPANLMVIGEVIARGDELEVYARAVNTETSQIAASVDTHIADRNNAEQVDFGLDAIAYGLVQAFPRVQGEIRKVDKNQVIVDIGKQDGVREGMYLYVVQEEPPVVDDTTGEVLIEGDYTYVGRARITQVFDKASRAEPVKREEGANLEQGMPAVTM
jgi:hypothetical protein